MSSAAESSVRASFGWLLPYVRRHAGALVGVIVLAAATSLLAAAQPYLSKLIIDDGLIGRRFDLLVWLCGAIVGLAALGFVAGGINRWQYVRVSGRILFALREDVYAHLLKLPPSFFRSRPIGDLVVRLDGDVAEVQRFSTDTLLAFVNGVLMLVAAAAIMIAMSPQLALVAACMMPLQLLLRYRARPYVLDTTRSVREQTGRVTHFLVETLGSAKAVQGAAAESWEQARLGDLNRGLLGRLLRQQLTGYAVGGISSLLAHVTTAAVFIVGGLFVMRGALTVGTLVAFTAYLVRGTGSAVSLMNLYTAYQRAAVSLQRVRELLDAAPASSRTGEQRVLEGRVAARLRFDRVSFRWPGSPRALLDGLTLEVPAGSKIVIWGESGAGKSTLLDLLRGFAEPDAGRILIDGVELGAHDIGSVRRHIPVLESEPVLFRGSVLHNIRYGNFDASHQSVIEAARQAGVDAFVSQLPQGYDTELGSAGAGLSTGQRQRIAIARALLSTPAALVLDEATSNLDTAAARSMHELIDQHFGHRTRLVITHSPRLIAGADRVLELHEGRLRETQIRLVHA